MDPNIHKLKEKLTFKELQIRLHGAFQSKNFNVDALRQLMESYDYKEEDMAPYAHFSAFGITRNLVDSGNENFNLILVCWEGGQRSTIHDHTNSHCFMRQLTGASNEIRYEWPNNNVPLIQKSKMCVKTSEVSYIHDTIGLHRVENNSSSDRAMTLHLYSPPIRECKIFSEETSESSPCKIQFWTEFGKKTDLQNETSKI